MHILRVVQTKVKAGPEIWEQQLNHEQRLGSVGSACPWRLYTSHTCIDTSKNPSKNAVKPLELLRLPPTSLLNQVKVLKFF